MQIYIGERPSERAKALHERLCPVGQAEAPETCVVLGGDGSMLHAVHRLPDAELFVGVNCGFLGFLMNDLPEDPDEAVGVLLAALRSGLMERSFPCLEFDAELLDGSRAEGWALNDLYIERQTGQTCHLRVLVDEVEVVSRMVCDGVIVATPLGSTAYSFSAGGAAAHPLVEAIQLTAICPHAPRLAPLMLPLDAVVVVEVREPARRPARIVADGLQFPPVTSVRIGRSARRARLGFLPGHDFTATMIRKILRP